MTENEIKTIKQMIKDGHILQSVIEKYFPELKESEDERIRKDMISYVKRIANTSNISPDQIKEFNAWISWLEKQNPNVDNANKEYWKGYREGKQEILDKYAELEKQGEQKSADKIEPKFKGGDFIVYRDHVWKVFNISLEKYYELLKINNEVATRSIEDVDNNAHLWTIQDVKDGDILSWDCTRYTIIFKELKDNKIIAYCSYNDHSEHFGTRNYDTIFSSNFKFIPATKDQRDLLFQKMKEAGYEWDAEKKELRKLSKKTAWSEEDAHLLDNCISLIEDIDCTEEEQNWLKGIKDRVQPQQEWSEEDEIMREQLLTYMVGKGDYRSHLYNWLESLNRNQVAIKDSLEHFNFE